MAADGTRSDERAPRKPGVEARFIRYLLDDGREYFLAEIAALCPEVPYNTVHKRLRRGIREIARLQQPKRRRSPSHTDRSPSTRDMDEHEQREAPLNAGCRAWTHTTRGRALQLLDLNYDPLRARI